MASLFCRNFSTQIGVRAATTAVSARSAASLLAVPPVIQPPQENPMTIDAMAPVAIPWRRRVRDSPRRIEGTCMAFAFRPTCFGARSRTPGWVPIQLELKTERLGMAYRLLFGYAFVRAESEQNSSHPDVSRALPNRGEVAETHSDQRQARKSHSGTAKGLKDGGLAAELDRVQYLPRQ